MVATDPKRAVLTTGLTAAGLTCTHRGARLVDDTGLTAAGLTPTKTAGNCTAICFHDKLLFQGLITRWTPQETNPETGAGTSRARSNTPLREPPRIFTLTCAVNFRTGFRLLSALRTNRDG